MQVVADMKKRETMVLMKGRGRQEKMVKNVQGLAGVISMCFEQS